MKREQILKLSRKNIDFSDLEKARHNLASEYDISFGQYDASEIRKNIDAKNPVIIKDSMIIGYNKNNNFVDTNNREFPIERMVKAIIVEDERDDDDIIEKTGDYFAIMGRNEWEQPVPEFQDILGNLRVGEIFLPKHSAIFNFLNPPPEFKSKNIVSMLQGVQVNIYGYDNYVDNCIHEIGHLFWRTQINHDERIKFQKLYDHLRPAAIYEYKWEMKDTEEMFCTLYKWYVKSLLIHKSFFNILKHEDPEGLKCLQDVFDRIARDKAIDDIWAMNEADVFKYLNPARDIHGRIIRKKGDVDKFEGLELPARILADVDRFESGVKYVSLNKAVKCVVPVRGNRIDFKAMDFTDMEKARSKPVIYLDVDGVVADLGNGYNKMIDGDFKKDDQFTIIQNILSVPHFFRDLPVIEKGRDLYNALEQKYEVVFLTTPMQNMPECKIDKLTWIQDNFGHNDVIFSDNKERYVVDDKSILIDDMLYNLDPWRDRGGTAINAGQSNDTILNVIANVLADNSGPVLKQLRDMDVNTSPTQAEKDSGNYKKGKIKFKGLNISVENPKGSIRFGFDDSGRKWMTKMKSHYGYIQHQGEAIDGDKGDKIDVFIGDDLNSSKAFVVNQSRDGMFDESKVMLGFDRIEDAEAGYLANYKNGWDGLDSIKQTNIKQLRQWLNAGNFSEPFSNGTLDV